MDTPTDPNMTKVQDPSSCSNIAEDNATEVEEKADVPKGHKTVPLLLDKKNEEADEGFLQQAEADKENEGNPIMWTEILLKLRIDEQMKRRNDLEKKLKDFSVNDTKAIGEQKAFKDKGKLMESRTAAHSHDQVENLLGKKKRLKRSKSLDVFHPADDAVAAWDELADMDKKKKLEKTVAKNFSEMEKEEMEGQQLKKSSKQLDDVCPAVDTIAIGYIKAVDYKGQQVENSTAVYSFPQMGKETLPLKKRKLRISKPLDDFCKEFDIKAIGDGKAVNDKGKLIENHTVADSHVQVEMKKLQVKKRRLRSRKQLDDVNKGIDTKAIGDGKTVDHKVKIIKNRTAAQSHVQVETETLQVKKRKLRSNKQLDDVNKAVDTKAIGDGKAVDDKVKIIENRAAAHSHVEVETKTLQVMKRKLKSSKQLDDVNKAVATKAIGDGKAVDGKGKFPKKKKINRTNRSKWIIVKDDFDSENDTKAIGDRGAKEDQGELMQNPSIGEEVVLKKIKLIRIKKVTKSKPHDYVYPASDTKTIENGGADEKKEEIIRNPTKSEDYAQVEEEELKIKNKLIITKGSKKGILQDDVHDTGDAKAYKDKEELMENLPATDSCVQKDEKELPKKEKAVLDGGAVKDKEQLDDAEDDSKVIGDGDAAEDKGELMENPNAADRHGQEEDKDLPKKKKDDEKQEKNSSVEVVHAVDDTGDI